MSVLWQKIQIQRRQIVIEILANLYLTTSRVLIDSLIEFLMLFSFVSIDTKKPNKPSGMSPNEEKSLVLSTSEKVYLRTPKVLTLYSCLQYPALKLLVCAHTCGCSILSMVACGNVFTKALM